MQNQSSLPELCCPHCGNKELSPLSERDLGGALAGGIAGAALSGSLLGGAATAATYMDAQTFWLCKKCGHKFRNPSELLKEYNVFKKRAIGLSIACGIFGVLSLVLTIGMFSMDLGVIGVFALIATVIFILVPLLTFGRANKRKKAYDELISGMKRFH